MKEKLRTLFQQKFNPKDYRKTVLENLLHAQQLLSQPQFLEETNDGDRIYGLGYLTDADGKQIGLYYTDVVSGDVRRKRVGFRQMMKSYVKYGADAAIAVFADKEHWRLSYMSDLKGGETSAKRFSYILGDPNGQYNTPVNRLALLGTQAPRLRLKDIFEAFSVETLSKEFFDGYHRHYDTICEYLTKHVEEFSIFNSQLSILHDYVKKMMGRIIFLHFLQKKGWLNGNQYFLRDLYFMSPYQADFLEQVLEPLFFGIFNTETNQRERLFADEHWDKNLLEEWKNLPYLNGGLFERDTVDKLHIKLPASLYEDLFTFLASYNFTVDENDPDDAEVGVDPEMLGKIFESLLEDNKAKGAFYTPKEIVRYMCKESLIAYLVSQIDKSQSEQIENSDNSFHSDCNKANSDCDKQVRSFVEHHEFPSELEPYRDTLVSALRNVKICDPAIGSGAFPMGLLNELWRCREALAQQNSQSELKEQKENHNIKIGKNNSDNSFRSDCEKEPSDCMMSRVELKKQIIENNIYGVDIERGAIDIARLRFWLSIVVDAEEPEPLPNFDYKFMQGNSLIESYKGIDLSRISNRLRGGQSKSTQLLLGLDSDFSKKNLQRLMRDYFSVTDHKQKASMRQAINDEVKHLITDFIGGNAADLANLDPSANQDFFLWHTWFKDIFDNGGFDIVIGNPPYISTATQMINYNLSIQRDRIIESRKYSTLYSKWDLYVPFVEHGIKILTNCGIFTMIIPYPITNQIYAKKLREFIIGECNMFELVDLNGTKIFDNATVSSCIPFVKRSKKNDNKIIVSHIYDNEIIVKDYFKTIEELVPDKKTSLWYVEENARNTDRFKKMHILGDYCYVSKGMVLYSEEGLFANKDLVSNTPDTIHCRKYIEAKDIDRYEIQRIRYIEYDTDRVPDKVSRPTFRELYDAPKLITNCLGELKVTVDIDDHFICQQGLRLAVLWKDIKSVNNKSITSSIKKYSTLSRIEMEHLSESVDIRYLLGILASKLGRELLTLQRAGDYHIVPEHIRNIPIAPATQKQQQSIVMLVEKIIAIKKSGNYDTTSIEHKIDEKVYQLYNLSPEEIAIIEQQ